jgi:general L-amino acid transport system permease protein
MWRALSDRIRRPDVLAQVAGVAAVAAVLLWAASTVLANLRLRGMASGFDFLGRPAGFDIAFSLIPYGPTDTHARVFAVGALNTLAVAAAGVVLATVLGVLAGVARRSETVVLRTLASAYVEVARNTPLPIQLLVVYSLVTAAPPPRAAIALGGLGFVSNRGLYLPAPVWAWPPALVAGLCVACLLATAWAVRRAARGAAGADLRIPLTMGALGLFAILALAFQGVSLPRPSGFGFRGGLEIAPPLLALLAALSLYTGGYIAEVVRGGLAAVAPGQVEAAQALGLTPFQSLTLVVFPQALRVMVPPLVSQYLNLLKNSSLAVVVGYPDLVATFGGTTLNQTGQAIETLGLVLVFYVAVSLALSAAVNAWAARQDRWARP